MVKFAVIGTGAIGGFYGGLLARAGKDVHFLVRSDFETVSRKGLFVESVKGDFHLPKINCYRTIADMPKCDVLLICTKTTANEGFVHKLPLVLSETGIVVPIQNGLGSDDLFARVVGADRVVPGLAFICAEKVAPGVVRHVDYGHASFGEYSPEKKAVGVTVRLEQLVAEISSAGIQATVAPDLFLAQLKKLVWNIAFNGLSVVHDATTQMLVTDPKFRQEARALMEEVGSLAAVFNRVIDSAYIDSMFRFTEKMVPYATSMKVDFEKKRPMEIAAIYGEPRVLANALGVAVPNIDRVFFQLQKLSLGI